MLAEPLTAAPDPSDAPSLQRLIRVLSGVLVLFVAAGVGSWFSGLCSWIGFYLGARDATLITVAQSSAAVGFIGAATGCLVWHRARARAARGRYGISFWAVPGAALTLLLGNVAWAIFVDATAWHYGSDIVRPAFDYAIMYLVLGAAVPLAVAVPWLVARLERRAAAPARSSST